jgi:hypothetical protein
MAKGDRKVDLKYLDRKTANYFQLKTKPTTGKWWASGKRDGVFGHIERSFELCSREANWFSGFGMIEDECRQLFEDHPWLTHIQGELWHPEWDFSRISSVVKSGTVPQSDKDQIEFHVFQVGDLDIGTNAEFIESNFGSEIYKRSDVNKIRRLRPVKFYIIDDDEVEVELESAITAGMEGLVLRWAGIGTPRQLKTYHKVKTFEEMDMTISGSEEGTGHITGMLGKLICVGEDDKGIIVADPGTGFKKQGHRWARKELWEIRDELPGKVIEVRYDSITPMNKAGSRSLRFPRFRRFKEDRS